MIAAITRLQLGRIEKRILENHKVPFTYDETVIKLIAERCTELESRGRMINAILPSISTEFLTRIMQKKYMLVLLRVNLVIFFNSLIVKVLSVFFEKGRPQRFAPTNISTTVGTIVCGCPMLKTLQ